MRQRPRKSRASPSERRYSARATPAITWRSSTSANGPSGITATRMKTKARPQTAARSTRRPKSAGAIAWLAQRDARELALSHLQNEGRPCRELQALVGDALAVDADAALLDHPQRFGGARHQPRLL